MRYPTSDDIISIHPCVIPFLTNQLKVFSRAVKQVWSPIVWSFRSFRDHLVSGFLIRKRIVLSFTKIQKWITRP